MSESSNPAQPAEPSIAVLLVEEDQLAAERLFEVLRVPGLHFEITHVRRVEEALERLQHGGHDVVLLDLSIHEGYGLDSLYRARVAASSVPIVVLTYQNDHILALKAARAGAQDYLIKGEVTPALITRTLVHAVERHRMLRELRDAQQRQQFLAHHDPLTRLPNRYSFLDALSGAITDSHRTGSRLAVLFFDLDGFKAINDNLGHAVGDELLTDVASRLGRVARRGDVVARLGGDEFVAALRDVPDREMPARIAEQFREELEKTYYVGGIECWVSASIGVSMFPDDGDDADLLIRHADTAMYHAKSAGRNHVSFFEPEMNDAATERFNLVNGLREAIHGGDLVLEFQPQVDVATEELIGAETLVRWRHPTRGVVAPGEFISVAEDTGMMVPLGEWILRTACDAAASWKSLTGLRVAVNISGRQLEQENFPERVAAILGETGLPAGRLELELTESLATTASAVRALTSLRELGVRVAIDDFGTGYSSLTLLKRLPADMLKIDQSFVRESLEKGPGTVILDAIVRMASGLGLDALAEGVETLEEMDRLQQLGCHRMQGYLLSKPIPKGEFEAHVTAPEASWRLPIARPESWSPPSIEELRAAEQPAAEEDFSDEALPVLHPSPRQPR